VMQAPVMEMYTVVVVAKVMARKTNASWSSRAHLSHKAATRTNAFAIQRGVMAALEITILTVVIIQVGTSEEPAVMVTAMVVVMVFMTLAASITITVR